MKVKMPGLVMSCILSAGLVVATNPASAFADENAESSSPSISTARPQPGESAVNSADDATAPESDEDAPALMQAPEPVSTAVQLDANGGVGPASVEVGAPLPAATREGYHFLGWTISRRPDITGRSPKENFTVDFWEGDAAPAEGEKPQSINYTTGAGTTLYALWASDGAIATYFGLIDINAPRLGMELAGDMAVRTADSSSYDSQSDHVVTVAGGSTVSLRSYLGIGTVGEQLNRASSILSRFSSPTTEFANPTAVMLRDLSSSFTVNFTLEEGLTPADISSYTLSEVTADGTTRPASMYSIEADRASTTTDPVTGLTSVSIPLVLNGEYPTLSALADAINAAGSQLALDVDVTVANEDRTYTVAGTVSGHMTSTAVFSRGEGINTQTGEHWYTYKYAIPFTYTWTGVQGDDPANPGVSGKDSTLAEDDARIALTLQVTSVEPTPEPAPTTDSSSSEPTPSDSAQQPTSTGEPAQEPPAPTQPTKTTTRPAALPRTGGFGAIGVATITVLAAGACLVGRRRNR